MSRPGLGRTGLMLSGLRRSTALIAKGRGPLRWVIGAVVFIVLSSFMSTGLVAQSSVEAPPATVQISVFSLFKPTLLRVSVVQDSEPLVLDLDGELEPLSLGLTATIEMARGNGIRASADSWHKDGVSLHVDGGHGSLAVASTFWLEVPGKLRRRFVGMLEIRRNGDSLVAIVTMPLETAVASVVQAESPPNAPIEALKAQAVAARSFLVARQSGHVGFDFCDTTHCQFLRSPPSRESMAAKATRATQGMVLRWHDPTIAQDKTVAAMYARSCGGHTRSLSEIGVSGPGYPYYAVRCTYCSRHSEIWKRDRDAKSDTPSTEQQRLAYNRVHGWSAIPSLPQKMSESEQPSMTGRGVGHGLGLCQLGAADMARHGARFDRILAHYYPNTHLSNQAH